MADRWRIKQSRRGDREFPVCEAKEKKVTKVEKKNKFGQRMRKTLNHTTQKRVFPSFE